MPPPRGSRPGCGGGYILKLLVVASLCCCGFVLARWGTGVLPSDSGRMAGAVAHAGHLGATGYYGGGCCPPRCTSKCGSCSPCAPVHVSVPPGVLVTTEYYPVAWRCKCRDRLYMP